MLGLKQTSTEWVLGSSCQAWSSAFRSPSQESSPALEMTQPGSLEIQGTLQKDVSLWHFLLWNLGKLSL